MYKNTVLGMHVFSMLQLQLQELSAYCNNSILRMYSMHSTSCTVCTVLFYACAMYSTVLICASLGTQHLFQTNSFLFVLRIWSFPLPRICQFWWFSRGCFTCLTVAAQGVICTYVISHVNRCFLVFFVAIAVQRLWQQPNDNQLCNCRWWLMM